VKIYFLVEDTKTLILEKESDPGADAIAILVSP